MYRKDNKNEFFTIKARKEGYPARSVYKLQEIDRKYRIIQKGDNVLDLGSAPGSWLLYASKMAGDKGSVVGIDIEKIKTALPGNVVLIQKDIMELAPKDLTVFNKKFQAVISDLAPKTSGMKFVDEGRSLELGLKALLIAKNVLSAGGNFVCKIFEGEGTGQFIAKAEQNFKFVKRFRPKAVKKDSKEFYLVAKGLNPE